jgi:alpha-tubulin suppressor-like RCC1 family protein
MALCRFALLFTVVSLIGCDELPVDDTLTILLEQESDWPTRLAITETDTLEVTIRISGPGGERITGVEVEWQSSDVAVLEVIPLSLQPRSGTARAAITARASGTAEVTASVDRAGFAPVDLRASITVEPLTISRTAGWRDVVTVTDADALEIRISNSVGDAVTDIRVSWQSSDTDVLKIVAQEGTPADTLSAIYRAIATAHGRGTAEVVVTVRRDGFESSERRDTISVLPVSVEEHQDHPWPATLSLTEIDTAEVEIQDANNTILTGFRVIWTSSDPEILGVVRAQPTESDVTPEQILAVQRKAVLTARRTGTAEIIALVDQEGFEPEERRATVTVVPLTTLLAPDSIVRDSIMDLSDTLEVAITLVNTAGGIVTGRSIHWQSTEESRLQVTSLPGTDSAMVIARDTGFATITAIVDPAGFEPMSFSDGVHVTPLAIRILHDPASPEDSIPNSETRTFVAEVRDIHDSIKTGREITWQTTNTSVIAILTPPNTSGMGSIKALGRGTATLTASIGASGAFRRSESSRAIRVMEKWVSVSAGFDHTCGVTVDGDAYCWGLPGSGLGLGNGVTTGSVTPVPVFGNIKFASISAGRDHSCGVLEGIGIVYCWGRNQYGAVGNNTQFDQLTPVQISLGSTFRSIVAGLFYTCGTTHTDEARCSGFHRFGQLGDLAPPDQRPDPDPVLRDCDDFQSRCALTGVPVRTGIPLSFVHVSAGKEWFTCGVRIDSKAVCWGRVPLQVTGDFDNPPDCFSNSQTCMKLIQGDHTFRAISTGYDHACGVTAAADSVVCWGRGDFGQLGDGSTGTGDSVPVQVSANQAFSQVSAGMRFTCAVAADSSAYCWGDNTFGQLGTGSGGVATPERVAGSLRFAAVSAGWVHTCGVTTPEGAAYCWGRNITGQLGDSTTIDRVTPVRVREPESN